VRPVIRAGDCDWPKDITTTGSALAPYCDREGNVSGLNFDVVSRLPNQVMRESGRCPVFSVSGLRVDSKSELDQLRRDAFEPGGPITNDRRRLLMLNRQITRRPFRWNGVHDL